jgi:GNAT superfamily N-acetyltransferase
MTQYRIVPFEPRMAGEALGLFRAAYTQERACNPLLPNRPLCDDDWIKEAMLKTNCNIGVAAFVNQKMAGYMLASFQFNFKGQRAAIVREFAHAAAEEDKERLYQRLYAALGQELVNQGINLHIVWHFAHDAVLKETLFQLGFGAFVAGRIRDLSPVEHDTDISIAEERDFTSIADLHREQMAYYLDSPVFLLKDTSPAMVKAQLRECTVKGSVLFVYHENKKTQAYFIVGNLEGPSEEFLLLDSNIAKIQVAYAVPSARNRSIGQALLAKSIAWAKENSYTRLFVIHETANMYGNNFWRKYFQPFLYCSMRYVDTGVIKVKQ